MTPDLKKYLLEQCTEWMHRYEWKALTRIGIAEEAKEEQELLALANFKIELAYGFKDEKTNKLVELGKEKLELAIAERLLADHGNEILNNCPKCGLLARTPKAQQCRHCGHDWHPKQS